MHCSDKRNPIAHPFLAFLLILSSTSLAGKGFDYSPITLKKDDPCQIDSKLTRIRVAVRKLTQFCEAQNRKSREQGFPSCSQGFCMESFISNGQQPTQIGISASSHPYRPAVLLFLVHKLKFGEGPFRIRCHAASPEGPFTLDQMPRLRSHLDFLYTLKNCTKKTEKKTLTLDS